MAPRHHQSSQRPLPEGTIVGSGIHVHGRVSGAEDLRVEGRVEGSIQLSETLYVAGGGVVVAEVRARDVVVSGIVLGNVTAENSITLNAGAKLIGDIAAPRIIIADGAAFSGNVTMGGEPPPRRERERKAARARPTSTARPARAAAPPRPAPPVRATVSEADDDATVVVRHAAVAAEVAEAKPAAKPKPAQAAQKKKTKKAPPRARVPKPGKRRVGRR